ncbi:NlpC/P60 family protein [Malaciobacter mytili]|uniref:NlpC/P60 domain-containing protein n=1 Tax=Malaciobacter mytili LMG 24559 TaxID=1032238 RepID=A0AAX2AF39_9BACT|nr:NlpC/P60 family protein [Malaciobacter mytili]AXH13919.1 outer membrane lipoprotein, NlpC/P60 family [Malaciobacter mytili LMG 24559]RXI43591.1 hypothetical protein CRU99_07100 [Malaciobacter mytili]RXK14811.1 hypothetical protein CP985_11690 [Malaciobacter mytili LMG 24559]
MLKKYLFLFLIPLFFTACSYTTNPLVNPNIENIQSDDELTNLLLNHYYEWKGVKYKYGGNSKKGIDCSAFIQKTYITKLNVKIPRTTYYQSRVGKSVAKINAKAGDLVFFKTGKNSRHVGIYLDDGKFMHVSKKKGVIISSLDNIYFKKHFWKIQRVLEEN